jgi:hypothetical protein
VNNRAYDAICRSIWREETAALDEAEGLLKRANEATHKAFIEAILRVRCVDRARMVFIHVIGFGVGAAFGIAFEDWALAVITCFVWMALYWDHGVKWLMIARYRANARDTRQAVERLRLTVEVREQVEAMNT